MKYYIADTHFRHGNILRFDGRPWQTVEEMEADMIKLWNERVTGGDEVYILGDLCWGKQDAWLEIIPQLNGRKHLIAGNHDLKNPSQQVRSLFCSPIAGYKEEKDEGRNVILCHYPILPYRHDGNANTYMLHGHVHNTEENELLQRSIYDWKRNMRNYKYQGKVYNVFCGFFGYAPVTLDEIIEYYEGTDHV